MKNIIIFFAVALLSPHLVQAQGITYLSNLGQPSAGSDAVGSDSWDAVLFQTGNNTAGYTLDSVQLALADATGNPGGFTAMIYSVVWTSGPFPGSSLGTLAGSLSPISAGIYSYAPTTSFTLPPNTPYFLVLTAETAVSNGAYEWDYANSPSYNPIGGWGWGDAESSVDGTSWNPRGSYFQFAINATAVPEPGVLSLLGLGGLCFLWHRRKKVD
jgi:PEP-CTERM motif